MHLFWACEIVHRSCSQHTVTFSKSASEEVGDRGLIGLREGELPTLETYSGSGTYRTCKHNPCLYLHRPRFCANTRHTTHAHTGRDQENVSHTHMHTQTAKLSLTRQITWLHVNSYLNRERERHSQCFRISSDGNGVSDGFHGVRTHTVNLVNATLLFHAHI